MHIKSLNQVNSCAMRCNNDVVGKIALNSFNLRKRNSSTVFKPRSTFNKYMLKVNIRKTKKGAK